MLRLTLGLIVLLVALPPLAERSARIDPHSFSIPHDTSSTSTTHRRVCDLVAIAQLPPLLAVLGRQRARVHQLEQPAHFKGIGAGAGNVDSDRVGGSWRAKRNTTEVTEEGNGALRLGILANHFA